MITRADFMLKDDVVFLNHGSFGAMPKVLWQEQQRITELIESQPVQFYVNAHEPLELARQALARFVDCGADDLIFVTNSTYGVNVAAEALCRVFNEGEILTTNHEYGACVRSWERYIRTSGSGLRFVIADVSVPIISDDHIFNEITSRASDRTRILFLSHITAPTAVTMPVKRLCAWARERGIITVIDGAHAPGQIPLSLRDVDADIYTANCHKWMCTPKGSAFLFVKRECQKYFEDGFVVSWGDFIRPTAGKFIDEQEYLGTRGYAEFLTVPASITWMERNQWADVQYRARSMRNRAIKDLCEIQGIVGVYHNEDHNVLQMGCVLLPEKTVPSELKGFLLNEYNIEVVVQFWLGRPTLRLSVHAHTRDSDLPLLTQAVKDFYQKLG